MVEPGTGNVLAIAQNTKFAIEEGAVGKTSVNWAVDAKYGGSGGFAFGSTAKMFAVATRLDSGMPISSTITARPASADTSGDLLPQADFPEATRARLGAAPAGPCRTTRASRNGRDQPD